MTENSPTLFLFETTNPDQQSFNPFRNFNLSKELLPWREEEKKIEQRSVREMSKKIQKPILIKRKYMNVSHELRLELIYAVSSNGEQIKTAAKRLGINYSTAKAICQIFRKEGRHSRKTKTSGQLKINFHVDDKEVFTGISPALDLPDYQRNKNLTLFDEGNHLNASLEISKNEGILPQHSQSQGAQVLQGKPEHSLKDLRQNQLAQINDQSINRALPQLITDYRLPHLYYSLNPVVSPHQHIVPSHFFIPHNIQPQQFFRVASNSNYTGNEVAPINHHMQFNYTLNNQDKMQYIHQAPHVVSQAFPMSSQVMEYYFLPVIQHNV